MRRGVRDQIQCIVEKDIFPGSPIRDIEIKYLLRTALTDDIHDRDIYRKGIDHSYYYEGYTTYKAKEL